MMPDLRVGDTVEVKSRDEILATLDARGALDALPFMPEMLKYCGQRYKIYKRADKTSQYITFPNYCSRRMFRTVHLEGLRCDGGYHDGCDALCLLYWKEAWLKRVDGKGSGVTSDGQKEFVGIGGSQTQEKPGCTLDTLLSSTKMPRISGEERYSCQVTEVLNATSELKWWDFRQYYRDLHSGNIRMKEFVQWTPIAILNWAHQRILGGRIYPFIDKKLVQRDKTPYETLDLKVGDYVQVKSLEEILQTLDYNMKNRGMLFTKELIPYCGKTSKVIKIVKSIINEVDGKMLRFFNNCIILEDVVCTGQISDKRLFCKKSCYPYWREIWLKKI
jgi:hypothetical protein